MNQTLAYKAALEWYLDIGVDEALTKEPSDKTAMPALPQATQAAGQAAKASNIVPKAGAPADAQPAALGASEASAQSAKIAKECKSIEELKEAVASFDGLSLKKTASNLVFADGDDQADIMLIGEAPSADEDRQGEIFIGEQGILLNKILASIGLMRNDPEHKNSVYLTNLLNWRPPGNRTPSQSEIDVSLPFIERHIALVNPKILILVGGTPASALLGTKKTLPRIRGNWMEYKPITSGINENTHLEAPIKAIATFHPAHLLKNPAHKKAVWQDMLSIKAEREKSS